VALLLHYFRDFNGRAVIEVVVANIAGRQFRWAAGVNINEQLPVVGRVVRWEADRKSLATCARDGSDQST
jgi:hypothetical protein